MSQDFIPKFIILDRDIERYAERYCRKGEIMSTPAVFGHDEAVATSRAVRRSPKPALP